MKPILALFLCTLCLPASGADAGMDKQQLAMLPARMQEYVDGNKTAGLVTLVARHGKIVSFQATGYQDLESKAPMRKDSLFRIASLTKPITCAGIMLLVDEGKMAVIDPVEKYLPEYKPLTVKGCGGRSGYGCVGVPPARPINIEDLMEHVSGLDSDVPDGARAANLAELAALGAKTQLLFDPGMRWNYSNIGYDILGRVIEIVSHQPYDLFLKQRLFDPLKMDDTTFFLPEAKQNRLASLYTLTEAGLVRQPPKPPARLPMPAGGLISSAADILRFNQMMLNKGTLDGQRVLSAAAVTLMTTSHTGELRAGWVPGVGHGYGYEVVRNAEGMFRYNSIGSFVKGGAFRTYESVDPEKDLICVLMMQLTNGGGDAADEINSLLSIAGAAVE